MADDLAVAELQRRIELLNAVGIRLSSEPSEDALLEAILLGAKQITGADAGSIYTVDPDKGEIRFRIVVNDSLAIRYGGPGAPRPPFRPIPLRVGGIDNHSSVVAHAVLSGSSVHIPDAYAVEGFDFSGTRAFDATTGYRSTSFLTVPMRDHEGVITGVLQLINATDWDGRAVPFADDVRQVVESLASQAATAISQRQLITGMRELLEAFIRLIATAIDEKSPHTGGHCKRVPELTMLLAEAAHRADRGPLAGFAMSDADRYELRIAAWLHDCGKITTPEWVVDKATKLQGLHDRIEIVAARFAAAAAADPARRAALADDLTFLRRCNTGGESMRPEDQERVRTIAEGTWPDLDGSAQPLLTAHEIRCLCIPRGTLLPEEREIINHHIVATIRMLESLPYPRHLRRVPEFAGGHHERMDGKGYPRGLRGEQMSVQARVMAIADVFEALTAGDRPYKKAYTLSQALGILGRMRLDGHIDPDLFDIFIRSGVWRDYAEMHLAPTQRDSVDLETIPGYAG